MIRQNASLTKRNNATQPTSKKKGEKKKRKDRGRAALLGNPRCINDGDSGVELHCVCLPGPLKQKSEADGVPKSLEWDLWAHLMVSPPGATD